MGAIPRRATRCSGAHRAPWRVVLANHEKRARLALIADLLDSFSYPGKSKKIVKPDRDLVFPWSPDADDKLPH